jgi:penicillin-binding protein-related factor A (putative recombinase)
MHRTSAQEGICILMSQPKPEIDHTHVQQKDLEQYLQPTSEQLKSLKPSLFDKIKAKLS